MKMTKVITYGTFDMLHLGHIRLLERAKSLGDYLIVGVTADDFDKERGKINVKQSLMDRVEAVKATGLADEIIVEEYQGQKINDIRNYEIDIFTVGSDWIGKFDYLNEYCKVVYLERTSGISSSEIRTMKRSLKLGLVGDAIFLNKIYQESKFVDGIEVVGVCTNSLDILCEELQKVDINTNNYEELIKEVDAVYVRSLPEKHYEHVKYALNLGKHVLCESPIALSYSESKELFEIAEKEKVLLVEGIKTAYSTAYSRLLLLIKEGIIGSVVSVEATCTSLDKEYRKTDWNGIYEWGPTAMLPVFQVLGTDYKDATIITRYYEQSNMKDAFTKINFTYKHSVATINVGDGIKSENALIISGTKGYIYVPAPWWNTDYFEIRYEKQNDNKRFFYQLDGEGIRYELVSFVKAIETGIQPYNIDKSVTCRISEIMDDFNKKDNVVII